jgi:hypothetical protein
VTTAERSSPRGFCGSRLAGKRAARTCELPATYEITRPNLRDLPVLRCGIHARWYRNGRNTVVRIDS